MNKYIEKIILLFCLFCFIACSDDSVSSGSSVMAEKDGIVVGCDTFSLSSKVVSANYILSNPDSLLLGECDNMFGTIKADILTQFACPEGFEYPSGSQVDSLVLFISYNSWYGDGNSPIGLKVYELDKNTFAYNGKYNTNIEVSEYCSMSDDVYVLDNDKIITAATYTDSLYYGLNSSYEAIYKPVVRIKLKEQFAKKFFLANDYSSQDVFNQNFKGLYITNSFGGSTVLYVSDLDLALYYHFDYQIGGRDTTISDVRYFYANSEVRQVNRIDYPKNTVEDLIASNDTVNFIVSPANVYTKLTLPMETMSTAIIDSLGNKRPYVNQALLKVDILNYFAGSSAEYSRDDWAQPSEYMLLIKESAVERFFSNKELPADSCAILSTITSTIDTLGVTTYSYSYDLSSFLTKQLRQANEPSELNMLLIPVSVTTVTTTSSYGSTTTSISAVNNKQTISATVIKSAQNASIPLKLEVVYSGF